MLRDNDLAGRLDYIVLTGTALSVGLFFVGRYTAGHATPRLSEGLQRFTENRSRCCH